jgi:hypothetical protein
VYETRKMPCLFGESVPGQLTACESDPQRVNGKRIASPLKRGIAIEKEVSGSV